MNRSTTILFLQDLRKSYPDRWVSQLLDHVLREHAVLDLTDGVAGLVGQSLEAHPDQDGVTDVVSPDARPAALAGLDSGDLLFFTMKLPGLPAEAGRFLHGLGGEVRGVVGDHTVRVLGGKRQAEQFELMALGEAPQVDALACKLLPGAPSERV